MAEQSTLSHLAECALVTAKSSPVNWLLLFVPLGVLAGELEWASSLVFGFNFFAIVPLASILAFATEELGDSLHNDSLAGLLNATFGNAVEVIVSIIALRQNQITVVQSSMLGSILSNLLLVLGSCFIVGGLQFKEQHFNQTAAQTMGSLLAVAVMALLLPAAFRLSLGDEDAQLDDQKTLFLSRGTSVVLLMVYCFYLVFQLNTHEYLFKDAEDTGSVSLPVIEEPTEETPLTGEIQDYHPDNASHNSNRGSLLMRPKSIYDLELTPKVHLSAWGAVFVLVLSTVFVSFCADYLVGSIDAIVASSGLSKTFIGLIVIPIVGNAAEHVTAIFVAHKNKMDLAIGVAIGSSIQIAIFVTPLLVVVGWAMGVDMSLYFDLYETAVIFVSVFITNSLILDGSSNWLEGVMLVSTYAIIAISFFLLPDNLKL